MGKSKKNVVKVVRFKKDIDALKFGDQYVIEVPGMTDDPDSSFDEKVSSKLLELKEYAANKFR